MKFKLSHMQVIALGFAICILIGTVLLSLPAATQEEGRADFETALFTATSATCVTGLVVEDTATYWSYFGQVVILILIQIGGLGFMSIATVFLILMRKHVGLRQREVMAESISLDQSGSILNLTKLIIFGTLFFELCGALLLSISFVPRFGLRKGVYYSIFHSVSAFCNAGFDLMGVIEPYSSLTHFADDILLNFVIMALIIIGGSGFVVWEDIRKKKLRFKLYKLHTKIVLMANAVLIFGGALLLLLLEKENYGSLSLGQQVLRSLFGSVTARTAGFNSVDTAALSESGKLLTMILMFIGGSPGSTAGGIKTTTIVVIIVYTLANLRSRENTRIFGRSIGGGALKKAVYVFSLNGFLIICASLLICGVQKLQLTQVLFETISAMSTVGMSTGITRELLPVSKLAIVFLMYLGRVGSVSFGAALMQKRKTSNVTYPPERITIG